MSATPRTSLKKLEKFNLDISIAEIFRDLESHFSKSKNPKIFLFLMFLFSLAKEKQDTKIYFNILNTSYHYDVCERTIENWLKELEEIELLKFNFKNKQLYFIEILDYKKSKIFRNKEKEAQEQELPTRFFRNVFQILKEIQKEQQTLSYKIDSEEERYILDIPKKYKEIKNRKYIGIDFKNKLNPQFSKIINYENLSKNNIPSLNNPHHLRIIKKQIRNGLELLSS